MLTGGWYLYRVQAAGEGGADTGYAEGEAEAAEEVEEVSPALRRAFSSSQAETVQLQF